MSLQPASCVLFFFSALLFRFSVLLFCSAFLSGFSVRLLCPASPSNFSVQLLRPTSPYACSLPRLDWTVCDQADARVRTLFAFIDPADGFRIQVSFPGYGLPVCPLSRVPVCRYELPSSSVEKNVSDRLLISVWVALAVPDLGLYVPQYSLSSP